MNSESEGFGQLEHGGEAGVPLDGQRLVQALATHASPAGQVADIAGTGHDPESLGDQGRIVVGLFNNGL